MDKTVPSGRVKGTLTPPCSKSYAQRALAASLLCEETSVLRNIEFCSDTRSALQCIETLGARVTRIGEETLSIEGAAAGPTRHHDPCAERGFDPLSGHDHRHRGPFRRGNLP